MTPERWQEVKVVLDGALEIERNDRAAARTLLSAQTSARLLERLLTLRVVKGTLQQALQRDADPVGDETEEDDSGK